MDDESQQSKGPVGDATGSANEATSAGDNGSSEPPSGNPQSPGPVLSGNGLGSGSGDDGAGQEPRHRRVKVMAEPGDTATRPTGDERPAQPQIPSSVRPTPKLDPKIDPLLRQQEVVKGSHPGDKYVR